MHLDGRDFTCPADSFVYVPRGLPRTPAAMEGYFEDLAEALSRGVDEDGLGEIAARYAMDVLGPPPQGFL
jgi:hypothetical protein